MIIFHQTNREPVTDRHPRRSFTLIELLMVIVIMSILMSLALAAYKSVMTNARIAEVVVEIKSLSSALAEFKAKFGFYPPSKIMLPEDPSSTSWFTADRAVIRRMFPQFNFSLQRDINGDGDKADVLYLTGAECLVFFLGGVSETGVKGKARALLGFSSNPFNPFSRTGSNRIGPFFDFDFGRLTDAEEDVKDQDGMQEFVSPLSSQTTPYLYLSSYNGRGYRSPNNTSTNPDIPDDLDVFPDPDGTGGNPRNMRSVYTQASNTGKPWKPKSFQIICPGFDNEYGRGGAFDPNSDGLDLNVKDYDNITNLHTGVLSP